MNSSELLTTLKSRFENNMHRHSGVAWSTIAKSVEANPDGCHWQGQRNQLEASLM